ncbi:MAG: tetratricopeptide repeat protein, partial [Pseudomonadota bacterium]
MTNVQQISSIDIVLEKINQKQYHEALELINEYLKHDLDNIVANFLLGFCLSAIGRYDQAIQCLQKACALKPDEASFHSCLGVTFVWNHQLQQGIEALHKAVELNPANVEDAYMLATAYLKADRNKEAYQIFDHYRSQFPDHQRIKKGFEKATLALKNNKDTNDHLDIHSPLKKTEPSQTPNSDILTKKTGDYGFDINPININDQKQTEKNVSSKVSHNIIDHQKPWLPESNDDLASQISMALKTVETSDTPGHTKAQQSQQTTHSSTPFDLKSDIMQPQKFNTPSSNDNDLASEISMALKTAETSDAPVHTKAQQSQQTTHSSTPFD